MYTLVCLGWLVFFSFIRIKFVEPHAHYSICVINEVLIELFAEVNDE